MPTREEIDALKQHWKQDPHWDIEDTEGFEEHRTELALYHAQMDAHWTLQKKLRTSRMALELKCSLELAEYLEDLGGVLDKLSARLDALEGKQ